MPIRVTIFEDNSSLRNGLQQLINSSDGFVCVGAFADCEDLFKNIENNSPDVILMDIQMPGINGIEAVSMLHKRYPDLKILMQTIFDDGEKIFESILAGASGYILKTTSSERILEFIKETYEGGAPMSPAVAAKVLKMVTSPPSQVKSVIYNLSAREKEILSCLVNGLSYKLIANACSISIDTVRGHIRNIYEKLHVHSKGEAIVTAIKNNIV